MIFMGTMYKVGERIIHVHPIYDTWKQFQDKTKYDTQAL